MKVSRHFDNVAGTLPNGKVVSYNPISGLVAVGYDSEKPNCVGIEHNQMSVIINSLTDSDRLESAVNAYNHNCYDKEVYI